MPVTETEVTVRRATPADLETVIALRVALLREYHDHPVYGRLRDDAETRARPTFAAQLSSPMEVMFLALHGDAAVGLIRCVDVPGAPMLLPDRYCYVSSVYVKPEFRRRGILRDMLAQAREWCRDHGLTEMRLHNVGTSSAAVGAWDALGFDVVEQVRVLRLHDDTLRLARDTAAQDHPGVPA
jgi:ribosomal protein S18 acetylase RimI-like enzyme